MLALALGCDRRLEPWVPAEQEPPAPARSVRVPGLETPMPRSSSMLGELPVAPPATGEGVSGVVRLVAGLSPPDGATLFVIARRAGAGAGPPLAVKRLPAGPFPMRFELGPADAMMAGQPFEGELAISARLDTDGDPMTRQPGDLAASLAEPVQPGASAIELLLEPAGPS